MIDHYGEKTGCCLVRIAQVGKKYSQEGILSRFGEHNLRSRKTLSIRVETDDAQELGADSTFCKSGTI
jgi:hypothetical protein